MNPTSSSSPSSVAAHMPSAKPSVVLSKATAMILKVDFTAAGAKEPVADLASIAQRAAEDWLAMNDDGGVYSVLEWWQHKAAAYPHIA